jgi:hypothetical protein
LALLMLLLAVPVGAAARERPMRTVLLTDGTALTGLYEELIDGKVRLEHLGKQILIEPDKVEAVFALADPLEVGAPARSGDFELGAAAGLSLSAGATHHDDAQLRLRALGGYQLGDWAQIGFDASVLTDFRDDGFTLVDLAAVGTFHLGQDPIVFMRILAGMETLTFGGEAAVGPLFGGGAGVKIPVSRRGAVLLGITYTWSSISVTARNLVFGAEETDVSLSMHRLAADLGFVVYF